jgi:putative membrane protein
MSNNQFRVSCLAASLAMAFMVHAHAQTSSSATSPATTRPNSAVTPSVGTTPPASASSNANVSHSDKKFIEKAAEGGMAEVQLGQMAAQKASDPQVKQFAQRMVEDHSKANDKLKQVAASKNVTLPTEVPSSAKREEDKLNKLSGDKFDKEYMNHMVSDHKKDVSEFRSATKSKDPDVQRFASETLPTIEQHLQMAQSIAKSK